MPRPFVRPRATGGELLKSSSVAEPGDASQMPACGRGRFVEPNLPVSAALKIPSAQARRFLRRALLLDTPAPDISTALAHLGYIQIDPINVCGRMHDLILRNRVRDYREGDLHAHIHSSSRPGFEHYLPVAAQPTRVTGVLVAFPTDVWPFLAARIRQHRMRGGRFGRKLAPTHEKLAQRILAEIADRGPLTSDDIEHDGRARSGWGTPGRLVKHVLEILLVHGRVLISARKNFRRVYDLPERVLPAAVLNAPEVSAAATARWLVLLKLRQRRLVTLTRAELPLVADTVQRIEVEGCPPLYCLREDLPALTQIENPKSKIQNPSVLLAPLDPLIYDRRLTSRLWNFDYTWEVYVPPEKRRRGYYALPVLAGDAIVGHVDPKADRAAGKLRVVSRSVRRGHRVADAVAGLARFLGLRH